MGERIEFIAVIPDLASAITVAGGEGEGVRLKLDAAGSEIAPVLRLLLWRGKLLRVTVELETDES